MGKVIKFPPKKNIEDRFLDSLDDEQQEMFNEILMKIKDEYETLQSDLIKKIAECEVLRLENESLKGGNYET